MVCSRLSNAAVGRSRAATCGVPPRENHGQHEPEVARTWLPQDSSDLGYGRSLDATTNSCGRTRLQLRQYGLRDHGAARQGWPGIERGRDRRAAAAVMNGARAVMLRPLLGLALGVLGRVGGVPLRRQVHRFLDDLFEGVRRARQVEHQRQDQQRTKPTEERQQAAVEGERGAHDEVLSVHPSLRGRTRMLWRGGRKAK